MYYVPQESRPFSNIGDSRTWALKPDLPVNPETPPVPSPAPQLGGGCSVPRAGLEPLLELVL